MPVLCAFSLDINRIFLTKLTHCRGYINRQTTETTSHNINNKKESCFSCLLLFVLFDICGVLILSKKCG